MYGARIRELRMEKGMTLRNLSNELGIPYTTLGNYEREDREPSFEVLELIANYFDVSIDYLTGRVGEKKGTKIKFLTEGPYKHGHLLNKASYETQIVASKTQFEFDSIFSNGIFEENVKELEFLLEIINFLSRMRDGFPFSKYATSDFDPNNHMEISKVFFQEKIELDKILYKYFLDCLQYIPKRTEDRENILKRFDDTQKAAEKK